ncbi:VOC family protein [Roseovarius sp. 2305UL8-3]|uniref:VOC family protein n=1 Tax=Roseovarius conchicola TaxID=3121636 RepID=UPI003528CDA2
MLKLDHIAIAAETLEEGRAYVEATLGVALQQGGQHGHYGTHNALLGLEDGLYLEVISIDPAAPKPAYPRWFDLDRFSGAARIGNWICRSDDIAATVAKLPQAGIPVPLSRGSVRWTMAVPPNGQLPYDNCFPALMQWQSSPIPADVLPTSGCRLMRLVIRHPQASQLQSELAACLRDPRLNYEAGPVGITAHFDTPSGPKVLT